MDPKISKIENPEIFMIPQNMIQKNINIFHRPTFKLQSDAEKRPVNLFSIGLKFFLSQITWKTRWTHFYCTWRRSEAPHAKGTSHVVELSPSLRISVRQFVMLSMFSPVPLPTNFTSLPLYSIWDTFYTILASLR